MITRGIAKLKKWGKRWQLRNQPRAIILLYHRVINIDSDPQLLSVSAKNFASHLEIINQYYQPISLQKLLQQLSQSQIKHNSVAITFDDGYADNLHYAKPLLEKYQIPATIFVTVGKIDRTEEFWWDDLERLLLQPGSLPERLSLSINDNIYHWEFGNFANYPVNESQQHRRWHVLDPEIPTSRHQIYLDLCSKLRPLSTSEREKLLQEIANWAGVETTGRVTHRALNSQEINEITADGLVEIGAHTMTHPVLSAIPKAEQQIEIQHSKAYLESLLKQPITSFAYPYGGKSDYTPETIEVLREAGFTYACSNFPDPIWKKSDRFQLPRFLVRNWSKEEFARRLQGWFNGTT
jgi:peptidoglycan/xylan/chitin deacetylase (PgdA/CDA1 family)